MSDEPTPILVKLLEIQRDLNVPKERWNKFGGFYSRSKEDILEAAKPMAHERGCVIKVDDEPIYVGLGGINESPWVYMKSTACLVDVETGEVVQAIGYAREPYAKTKMDASQLTGGASSYAGKRALGNLFAIDDTADTDNMSQEPTQAEPPASGSFNVKCQNCGRYYTMPDRAMFEALQRDPNGCNCGINAAWKVVN